MVNPIDSLKANRELASRERDGIHDIAKPTPGATPEDGSNTDHVSLTDAAVRLQKLERRLAEQSVIDEKRVTAIRDALDKGVYQINPERIADKLLAAERSSGNR